MTNEYPPDPNADIPRHPPMGTQERVVNLKANVGSLIALAKDAERFAQKVESGVTNDIDLAEQYFRRMNYLLAHITQDAFGAMGTPAIEDDRVFIGIITKEFFATLDDISLVLGTIVGNPPAIIQGLSRGISEKIKELKEGFDSRML